MVLDEICRPARARASSPRVATLSQITDLLKKTEQSQRVLDEASEGLTFDVLSREDNADENISIEKLTGEEDISPDHPPCRHDDLHRARAARLRYPSRDLRRFAAREVPHRRRAAAGDGAHCARASSDDPVAYQGHERARYRRAPRPAGWPFPRPLQGPPDRLPRLASCRPCMAKMPCCACSTKSRCARSSRKLSLDVVGFAEEDLRRFRRYIKEPYGMVLVTGPTGSGKTTTLYAALNEIKSEEDKIITIEDPVEYQIRGITQIPVNEKKGLTFARGLRSILRHDPDKILVGEIRDAGDGADRHQLRAHRPSRLHHGPRQQRRRRARPLPEHGRRAVQLRLRAELHPGAAAGAQICDFCVHDRRLHGREMLDSAALTRRVARLPVPRRRGLHRVRRHGLQGRTAIHELLDLTDRFAR